MTVNIDKNHCYRNYWEKYSGNSIQIYCGDKSIGVYPRNDDNDFYLIENLKCDCCGEIINIPICEYKGLSYDTFWKIKEKRKLNDKLCQTIKECSVKITTDIMDMMKAFAEDKAMYKKE